MGYLDDFQGTMLTFEDLLTKRFSPRVSIYEHD